MYNSLSWTTGRSLVEKYLKEADKLQRNPFFKEKIHLKKKNPLQCVLFTSIFEYYHGNNWKREPKAYAFLDHSFLSSQHGNFWLVAISYYPFCNSTGNRNICIYMI